MEGAARPECSRIIASKVTGHRHSVMNDLRMIMTVYKGVPSQSRKLDGQPLEGVNRDTE
jgi:hypothetical protein